MSYVMIFTSLASNHVSKQCTSNSRWAWKDCLALLVSIKVWRYYLWSILIFSNVFQAPLSPTTLNHILLTWWKWHSMDKVMGKCGNMLSITRPWMKGGSNMLVGIIASFIILHLVTHQDWWIKDCHGNTWDEEEFGNHLVLTMW